MNYKIIKIVIASVMLLMLAIIFLALTSVIEENKIITGILIIASPILILTYNYFDRKHRKALREEAQNNEG